MNEDGHNLLRLKHTGSTIEPMSNKHTSEPWNRNSFPEIHNVKTSDPAFANTEDKFRISTVLDKESYARACACVNALTNIPDPDQWVADMKAENERLKTEPTFSHSDMMDIAGWMAAADNKRPIPELKEEAIEYIKRRWPNKVI